MGSDWELEVSDAATASADDDDDDMEITHVSARNSRGPGGMRLGDRHGECFITDGRYRDKEEGAARR
jgi:hypothetical protein